MWFADTGLAVMSLAGRRVSPGNRCDVCLRICSGDLLALSARVLARRIHARSGDAGPVQLIGPAKREASARRCSVAAQRGCARRRDRVAAPPKAEPRAAKPANSSSYKPKARREAVKRRRSGSIGVREGAIADDFTGARS